MFNEMKMDRYFPFHIFAPRWSKKVVAIILFIILFLMIYGPSYVQWMFTSSVTEEIKPKCEVSALSKQLEADMAQYNAIVADKGQYMFFGNGYIGAPLQDDLPLYVKSGRTLSAHVPFYPNVEVAVSGDHSSWKAINYRDGIAYTDYCYGKVRVTNTYIAHRTIPSVLIQQIAVHNPTSELLKFELKRVGYDMWDGAKSRSMKIEDFGIYKIYDFNVVTGLIDDPYAIGKYILVSILTNDIPKKIVAPAFRVTKMNIFTCIFYTRIEKEMYQKKKVETENEVIFNIQLALKLTFDELKEDHINVWKDLWSTGFSVSYSKAPSVINGDTINATIYNVLSSVQAVYHKITAYQETKTYVINSLSSIDGCYASNHHTLEATDLWKGYGSLKEMNSLVSLWLLTLDKQGCQDLLKAGADGVAQAMVLSFGSFRFTKHHLEFNMHPSFLHRTYQFKRIKYGNATRVNVTVEISEDNKALLYVALDTYDKPFFACDGGCLNEPVQLGHSPTIFAVKLTKPFTAILYITPDKAHIEELRRTLHLKAVNEAPAQEQNLLIIHKHGHHLSGLPTFFWVSIITLIIIFHLFLIKLVYNEYWTQEKIKIRLP